jgi:hypothetical protein
LYHQLKKSLPQSTLSPQRKKKRLTEDKRINHRVTRKVTDLLTAEGAESLQNAAKANLPETYRV